MYDLLPCSGTFCFKFSMSLPIFLIWWSNMSISLKVLLTIFVRDIRVSIILSERYNKIFFCVYYVVFKQRLFLILKAFKYHSQYPLKLWGSYLTPWCLPKVTQKRSKYVILPECSMPERKTKCATWDSRSCLS